MAATEKIITRACEFCKTLLELIERRPDYPACRMIDFYTQEYEEKKNLSRRLYRELKKMDPNPPFYKLNGTNYADEDSQRKRDFVIEIITGLQDRLEAGPREAFLPGDPKKYEEYSDSALVKLIEQVFDEMIKGGKKYSVLIIDDYDEIHENVRTFIEDDVLSLLVVNEIIDKKEKIKGDDKGVVFLTSKNELKTGIAEFYKNRFMQIELTSLDDEISYLQARYRTLSKEIQNALCVLAHLPTTISTLQIKVLDEFFSDTKDTELVIFSHRYLDLIEEFSDFIKPSKEINNRERYRRIEPEEFRTYLQQEFNRRSKDFKYESVPYVAERIKLTTETIDFLKFNIQNIDTIDGQKKFIHFANLNEQLQEQIKYYSEEELEDLITFSGLPEQFFQSLIHTLIEYGQLENGYNALETVLEAAKNYVGPDKVSHCDRLIQGWRQVILNAVINCAFGETPPQPSPKGRGPGKDDTEKLEKNECYERQTEEDRMVSSTAILKDKIVAFLLSLPDVDDSNGQKTFVNRVRLDENLRHQIDFSGSPAQFFELFVDKLIRYGQLEDGRDAVEAILETAKSFVGTDKRARCNRLIQNWKEVKITASPKKGNNIEDKSSGAVGAMDKLSHFDKSMNRQLKKEEIMIVEALTTETIKEGVAFLINQLTKLTDRVNKEQLEKIREKAETAKTAEDVEEIKQFIQESVPDAHQIASVEAFTTWVEDTTLDSSELLDVGKITFKVLREVRHNEKKLEKQNSIKAMESKLFAILDEYKGKLQLGDADSRSKAKLYDAITTALNFIKM